MSGYIRDRHHAKAIFRRDPDRVQGKAIPHGGERPAQPPSPAFEYRFLYSHPENFATSSRRRFDGTKPHAETALTAPIPPAGGAGIPKGRVPLALSAQDQGPGAAPRRPPRRRSKRQHPAFAGIHRRVSYRSACSDRLRIDRGKYETPSRFGKAFAWGLYFPFLQARSRT